MLGTTAYDGACVCGGLIESAIMHEIDKLDFIESDLIDDKVEIYVY